MDVGIPRQKNPFDFRVGLTPMGVELLVQDGHRCYIEAGAGQGSGFSDERYRRAGGEIVFSADEVYGRSQLILGVARPVAQEFELLQDGHILCGFLHLAVIHPAKLELLLKRRVTAIAYETVQADDGYMPILSAASQIAGRMVPSVAAQLLQNNEGGHGLLLGGVPGVPAAKVAVVGAGIVGSNAAKSFKDVGADVVVLDMDLKRLQVMEDRGFAGRTMVAYPFNIARAVRGADVVVGSVLVPGARAPLVVTREMVRGMKPRSVIIDVAIDQGGCVETSRPTSYQCPTYIEEGVTHYCVPNMTGVVARTTTHAVNNAAWPYIRMVANAGPEAAAAEEPALRRGLNVHNGEIVHPALKESVRGRE